MTAAGKIFVLIVLNESGIENKIALQLQGKKRHASSYIPTLRFSADLVNETQGVEAIFLLFNRQFPCTVSTQLDLSSR